MVAWSASVTTDEFKIAVLHQAFSWLPGVNWKFQVVDYLKEKEKKLFQIYFDHTRMIILQ